MHQPHGNVRFLDGRIQVLLFPAHHTVDEVRVVGEFRPGMNRRLGLLIGAEPHLVGIGILIARGEIALGAVEDVPNGVVAARQGAERRGLRACAWVREFPIPRCQFPLHDW